MALTTRTVKATFTRPAGTAAAGTVQFRPSTVLQHGGTGVITPTTGLTATLNGSGAISILLPCTTQATTPGTFFYYVTERIDDQERSYQILLPTGVGDAQLAALAPPGPATQPALYTLQSTTAALTARVVALEAGTSPDPPNADDIAVDSTDTPNITAAFGAPNNQRDVNTDFDTAIGGLGASIAGVDGSLTTETAARTTADGLLDGRLDVLEGQTLNTRLTAAEGDITALQGNTVWLVATDGDDSSTVGGGELVVGYTALRWVNGGALPSGDTALVFDNPGAGNGARFLLELAQNVAGTATVSFDGDPLTLTSTSSLRTTWSVQVVGTGAGDPDVLLSPFIDSQV